MGTIFKGQEAFFNLDDGTDGSSCNVGIKKNYHCMLGNMVEERTYGLRSGGNEISHSFF